ncbi:MAG: class I SAM-dependent DNA methyltransferase [Acidobacteriota bacterium]|nr:class I SAM-dependent DNA methyltransferase [Acidobacteriota bacterium]
MPLAWNEIRDRAVAFSRDWKDEASETAEAKTFWDAFFNVFGITRRRIASFEKPVVKSDGKGGYIDLLWKGVLLVEHKSRGLDLDRAFHQATDYFHGLKERDLPRFVIVSDFARFRLYDLEGDAEPVEFKLEDLHKNIRSFGFIAGYQTRSFGQQDPVNIQAAEKLGKLHDLLRLAGYEGHALELFLVRTLFCLFAEDNAIFELQQFREWIEQRTSEDGSDLGPLLAQLFQALNTPEDRRQKNLDEHIAAFRYINGKLFEETTSMPALDRRMREMVLECTALDWSRISPAIFGALFQSIMDKKARRNLGAHYTSETNILKALQPLFLDSLRAEFERVRRDSKRLGDFHEKLRNIRVLDPACGCGNFLVIAYRELRLLELDVLRELFKSTREGQLDVSNIVFIDVDQFYGIEIEEFPAQIAQVALWMTDHQMNQKVSVEFGQYFARLPLKKAPTIIRGNALEIGWETLASPARLTYIVGNPPFVGKQFQTPRQKLDLSAVLNDVSGSGTLDYVSAWFRKASDYMQRNQQAKAAFVATNSITQGEQAGVLWPHLLAKKIRILFAHRTFEWTSEARGRAAVHCVVIGFGMLDEAMKAIFDYHTVKSEPIRIPARRINPYLVDAEDIFLPNRRSPIGNAPSISFGSMPNDGGFLILDAAERKALLSAHPALKPFIRPFIGSEEFINSIPRYCLWLQDISASQLRTFPEVLKRVMEVRKVRLSSTRSTTRDLAKTPSLFGEARQPSRKYLLIPGVSSETRRYIPMAFMRKEVIANNLVYVSQDATIYHFGVLTSLMHMAWVRSTCGRLKSDYRYSAGIVYNNFPWPEPTPKQRKTIETAAQAVLNERDRHPNATLADLYDPLSMPPRLVKAHQTLDRAVDAAYGRTAFASEAERVAFLFTLYEKLTTLFPSEKKKSRRASAASVRS